jgi:hypothetical protein
MPTTANDGAEAPGASAPANDDARVLGSGAGVGGQREEVERDVAMLAAAKRIDTVRARLALRGHTLHVVGAQGGETMFLVSAWGNSRTLASVDEVETFADIVSGART